MTIRTTCICGHDRASHYRDREHGWCSCLCTGCSCGLYVDVRDIPEGEPLPAPVPHLPDVDETQDDEPPPTDPMPWTLGGHIVWPVPGAGVAPMPVSPPPQLTDDELDDLEKMIDDILKNTTDAA